MPTPIAYTVSQKQYIATTCCAAVVKVKRRKRTKPLPRFLALAVVFSPSTSQLGPHDLCRLQTVELLFTFILANAV